MEAAFIWSKMQYKQYIVKYFYNFFFFYLNIFQNDFF